MNPVWTSCDMRRSRPAAIRGHHSTGTSQHGNYGISLLQVLSANPLLTNHSVSASCSVRVCKLEMVDFFSSLFTTHCLMLYYGAKGCKSTFEHLILDQMLFKPSVLKDQEFYFQSVTDILSWKEGKKKPLRMNY